MGARLRVPGYEAQEQDGQVCFTPASSPARALALEAEGKCRIRRLSMRLDPALGEAPFHMGPYHFTESRVPDLADYLDFTAEEYRQIAASPEAERLRREAKFVDLVGNSVDYSIWKQESGHWRVHDGVLVGSGAPARARFWQEVNGPLEVRLKVRLADGAARATLVLGEVAGAGAALHLAAAAGAPAPGSAEAILRPQEWQEIAVALTDRCLRWSVGGGAATEQEVRRGVGGGVLLTVDHGRAEFDDVLLSVPRRADRPGSRTRFYAFDRRETDWWRRGRWVDHGGIACAVATNWISLDAPDAAGWLVHKESFGHDVLVAVNVEENSEWLGWDRNPSHLHHPADNFTVVLATDAGLEQGYRLEVNSRDRQMTVLYRHGVEVAAVRQDGSFPIEYVGGHAPYRPRRNRICLVRQGDQVRVLINGMQVLTYRDDQPLVTPRLALGGRHTRFNLSNLLVRELPAAD